MERWEVRGRSDQRGFSLVDMTVAMGFVAIAAVTVLPNIGRLAARYRVTDAARRVESVVQYARMKAISERTNMVVQFTPGGWSLFGDTDRDTIRDSNEKYLVLEPSVLPERTVYEFPRLRTGGNQSTVVLTQETNSLAASGCKCATFLPSGLMKSTLSGSLSRSISVSNGSEFRQVTITNGGAVSIQRWSDALQRWE